MKNQYMLRHLIIDKMRENILTMIQIISTTNLFLYLDGSEKNVLLLKQLKKIFKIILKLDSL